MTAARRPGITLHTADFGALRAEVVVDPPVVTGSVTSPVDGQRWPVSGWFAIRPEPVRGTAALRALARTGSAYTLHGRLVLRLGDASVECQLRPDGRYPTVVGADRPPRIHQATADQVFAAELTRLMADAQSRIAKLRAQLTADAIAELIRQEGGSGRQAFLRLRLAEQELRLGQFGAAVHTIDEAASDAVDSAGCGAQPAEFRRQRDRLVEALDRVAGRLAAPVAESLHEAAELLRRRS
ncbi:hypothetical protein EDC02_3595 [Micromonospora sp. Llam0]|uniref:hypothetical protein n=1 Tax=Micromonospora sp. Llam0 TaxID=2485143 RepID=UPI000FB700C8|nr:hypothetical protein [Micromonospora sp. Llam0]ROO61646.1 hypothetical protein EDC02_3595 [Micromonospora sp. Llam0]